MIHQYRSRSRVARFHWRQRLELESVHILIMQHPPKKICGTDWRLTYKLLNLSNISRLILASMQVAWGEHALAVLFWHILHGLHDVAKQLLLKSQRQQAKLLGNLSRASCRYQWAIHKNSRITQQEVVGRREGIRTYLYIHPSTGRVPRVRRVVEIAWSTRDFSLPLRIVIRIMYVIIHYTLTIRC